MLFGTFPYKVTNQAVDPTKNLAFNLAHLVKTNKLNTNLYGVRISHDMENLLKSMITFDPKDRIIFQKLFKHKFFRSDLESQKNTQDDE